MLRAMANKRLVSGILGLGCAVVMLVAACGGSSAPSNEVLASARASVPAVASQMPSPATASPPPPSASAQVTVDLGEVGITPLRSRVTVHAFGPSDRSPEPPAGSAWLEADLEWCLAEEATRDVTIGNIRYEVALEMSDGRTISPDSEADSPDEVYASEGTFTGGDCVRGPLVFAVPTWGNAEYLLLVGRNGAVRWRLA